MKWGWGRVLAYGSVATLFLCAISVVAIYFVANFGAAGQLARMGAIGDTFGLAAALFSGLGFIGLAAALAFDTKKRSEDIEERSRYRLPFIVPSIEEDNAAIDRAARPRKQLEVDIRLTVTLANLTDEPALGLSLDGELLGDWATKSINCEVGDHPIGPKGEREGQIIVSFAKEQAESALRAFRGQATPIECVITSTCVSLSGKTWRSRVHYKLGVKSADSKSIDDILDPESGYEISPPDPSAGDIGGTEVIFLTANAVPGTWSHSADPS